jgi:ribosomal protein S18 acetylase RimI-like enzyme
MVSVLRPQLTIRRGGSADLAFVRALADDVLAQFGDYGSVLPSWLLREGVITHVAIAHDTPIGITMLAYYPADAGGYLADLLAIAVSPRAQRRGVGAQLLEHALDYAAQAKRHFAIEGIRLSVADTNARARRLFERFGFEVATDGHGYYDRGQRALHMRRGL